MAATAAIVHDSHPLPELLNGHETVVWGDSAYQGKREVIHALAPRTRDRTHRRYRRGSWLDPIEWHKNRTKSRVRAKVEHPFLVLKVVFGFRKVRYRSLA
jgi:IS5 family transposase